VRQIDDDRPDVLGLVLTGAAGFLVGVVGGMLLSGSVGAVHPARVRGALHRLRRERQPGAPDDLEDATSRCTPCGPA
jgi:hypothetical protein